MALAGFKCSAYFFGQGRPLNFFLLLFTAKVLERYTFFGQFLFPENKRNPRTRLVGLLELALEAATATVHDKTQPIYIAS